MRIEPDILMGVAVPVFALSRGGARHVLAWNTGMAMLTGLPTNRALGRTAVAVFGPGGAALQSAEQSGRFHIDGLGTVLVSLQGDLLVGTLSDHERDAFIGLAARDIRAPLRTIHQLADEAARDSIPTHPALARIKRIAREGMSMTQDVVSCAEAGNVAVSAFRKVAVAPLCRALADSISVDGPEVVVLTSATVIAERPLMQAAMRCLFEHLVYGYAGTLTVIEVDVREVPNGFCVSVGCRGNRLRTSALRLLKGGAFRGNEGYGLLGLRRLVRSRGGQITILDETVSGVVRIELTLPGCVIKSGKAASLRVAGT